MPRTKLHRTVENHRKQRNKTRKAIGADNANGLDVNKVDWSSFVNPFSLPEGVSIYEPQ